MTICISNIIWSVVLSSWGPINKASCTSDNKDCTTVAVEDAEVVQDKLVTRQPEKLEEESSPRQIAMESVDEEDSNVKDSFPHHLKHTDGILETPAVPFDSVS